MSTSPPGAVELVVALGHLAQQGQRNLLTEPLLVAMRQDGGDAAEQLRETALQTLAPILRRLLVQAGDEEVDSDARFEVAWSLARHNQDVDLGDLVDLLLSPAPRPRAPVAVSTRTAVLQLLAGGPDELDPDSLIDAITAHCGFPLECRDAVREDHHQSELAGAYDWLDELPGLLALERSIREAAPDQLRRAFTAALRAPGLQMRIVLAAAHPHLRDPLASLSADPFWRAWGRWQLPPLRSSHLVALVVRAAGLLCVPGWLAAAEAYVERLAQLADTALWLWPDQTPMKRHARVTVAPAGVPPDAEIGRRPCDWPALTPIEKGPT